jgi:O-succinylbenzoate synthase
MRINKLTIYHLDMPLVHPFETSFGMETRRECLVLAADGNGKTGWGECVALNVPSYSYETVHTAWHTLEDFLVPAVLNLDWNRISEFLEAFHWVKGHNMAKAGLQCTAWDLLAQEEGISLANKIGEPYQGKLADSVEVGISIGIQPSIDETLMRIEHFLDEGFSRVKLKIKPGWDLDLIQAVRRVYPDLPLMVDANSAYSLTDAELIKKFDDFDLIMIEQPLAHDDIYWHSQLQKMIQTPICLDESITTPELAEWALEIDAARIINIKPGRVGGLWESRLIHDLCKARNVPVWCGGMLETGIGRAANLALASLPNFKLPTDNGPTSRYWEQDIIEEEITLNPENSTIDVPQRPGLGVTPDLNRIQKYLVKEKSFQA